MCPDYPRPDPALLGTWLQINQIQSWSEHYGLHCGSKRATKWFQTRMSHALFNVRPITSVVNLLSSFIFIYGFEKEYVNCNRNSSKGSYRNLCKVSNEANYHVWLNFCSAKVSTQQQKQTVIMDQL